MLDQPLRNLGVGGAVVLLAATAGFGGLQPQTSDGPEQGAPETAYDVAPFEITVERSRWTTELPGVYLGHEGDRWVAVVATVRNTSDAAVLSSHLANALTLDGLDGARVVDDEVGVRSSAWVLLEDASALNPIQPGLEYEVAVLFEQDGSQPPPTEVTVRLQQHTWRPGSLDGYETWWEPTTTVEVAVPVTQAPDEAETEADA